MPDCILRQSSWHSAIKGPKHQPGTACLLRLRGRRYHHGRNALYHRAGRQDLYARLKSTRSPIPARLKYVCAACLPYRAFLYKRKHGLCPCFFIVFQSISHSISPVYGSVAYFAKILLLDKKRLASAFLIHAASVLGADPGRRQQPLTDAMPSVCFCLRKCLLYTQR